MLITFRKVCTFDWCKRLHQLDVQDSRDQPCLKIQQACKKQKLQVPWVIATFGATFGNFATYIHITYIYIYNYNYRYIYILYVYMLPRCLPIFPPNVCQLRWETDHPRTWPSGFIQKWPGFIRRFADPLGGSWMNYQIISMAISGAYWLELPTIYKAFFKGLCKGISPENMVLYGTVPPF